MTAQPGVIAEYEADQTGKVVKATGDFQVCIVCKDGQFVPHRKDLRTVPCEMKWVEKAE